MPGRSDDNEITMRQWYCKVTLHIEMRSTKKPTQDEIENYLYDHLDDLLIGYEMSGIQEL